MEGIHPAQQWRLPRAPEVRLYYQQAFDPSCIEILPFRIQCGNRKGPSPSVVRCPEVAAALGEANMYHTYHMAFLFDKVISTSLIVRQTNLPVRYGCKILVD